MIGIYIQNKKWTVDGNGNYAIGNAFINERQFCTREIIQYFCQGWQENSLDSYFRRLNGFYSVILKSKDGLIASVDRLRSYPLFYSIHRGKFYLSDNPDWIQKHVHDSEPDSLSKTEFLLTGYVTGQSTLLPSIRQIQAGECIEIKEYQQNISLNKKRWFSFTHGGNNDCNLKLLKDELNEVVANIHQRLIDVAKNRTIVVPLSGGYDSRLILTVLKKLNCKNVITFNYGRKGSRESVISRDIAQTLGYPWYFIEYDDDLWKKCYKTGEMKDYLRFSSCMVSLPHFQDWPAVHYLLNNKIISSDSVIVPGHTGDFISGGHVPQAMHSEKNASHQILVDYLVRQHYCLREWDTIPSETRDVLKQKISTVSGSGMNIKTRDDLVSCYEEWEWQERQAKFIINSVRVYDYFNLEWWLPLWDNEFIDFWLRVPNRLRMGAKLYVDYVSTLYSNVSGVDRRIADRTERTEPRIRNMVRKIYKYLPSSVNNYRVRRFYQSKMKNHSLSLYSIFDEDQLSYYIQNKVFLFNGILAHQYLQEIEEQFIRAKTESSFYV